MVKRSKTPSTPPDHAQGLNEAVFFIVIQSRVILNLKDLFLGDALMLTASVILRNHL